MLGITFIGSGSKGNSALLEFNKSYYLLDAGISCKRITDYLCTRNLCLSDIAGIFITHEHEDHTKGLKVLLKKAPNLKIYCTAGTALAINQRGTEIKDFHRIDYETPFMINGCKCTAFQVSHDAIQPMGLHVETNNQTMVMATDLGCVTSDVLRHAQNADILCIESNYDLELLKRSSYPTFLKQRIRSKTGHLPNEGVRGILSRMNKIPQNLVLMHLSQESNTKEKALESLYSFFECSDGCRFKNIHITVAAQDEPSERVIINEEEILPAALKAKLLDTTASVNKDLEVIAR